LSTEPPRNFRRLTFAFALVTEIFIMCAYRATWVSSQKPIDNAR